MFLKFTVARMFSLTYSLSYGTSIENLKIDFPFLLTITAFDTNYQEGSLQLQSSDRYFLSPYFVN